MRSGFWRKCRVCFRWCRLSAWLLLLAAVCAVVWFNQIGLPDFLKTRLVATLHERGVELQFSRMRLRFGRGIVAENVRIGGAPAAAGPSLTLAEVQLQLDYHALLRRRWQLDGLALHQGKLTWPVSPTNALRLENIETELRFQTNDTCSLDHFQANFAGARLMLSGDIAHASEIRNWEMFRSGGATNFDWQAQLQKFSDTVDRIHFRSQPLLTLAMNGDARNVKTFRLKLKAQLADATTPWGDLQQAVLDVDARPQDLNSLPPLTVRFAVAQAKTPWGSLHHGTLAIQTHAAPLLYPPPVVADLEAADADTPWGAAREIRFAATLAPSATNLVDIAWGWWTNLQPYQLDWTAALQDLKSEKLNAGAVVAGGFWHAPEFAVTNLSVELGGGKLAAAATLDVVTRKLVFTNSACFDLHALDALLAGITNKWLADISLPQPPSWQIGGALVLPAWTNSKPDWNGEVRPTVRLNGGVAVTNGTVFGVTLDLAQAHFSYLDLIWQLPDLGVTQAKTRLEISGYEDDTTKKYRAHVRGTFDPEAARPFLTTSNAVRGFEIVHLAEALALDVEAGGFLNNPDAIAVEGRVAVTNFTVRGEHFGDVTATVSYTNRVLELLQPLSHTGGQMAMADSVTLDFNQRLILFTNGFSTADPGPVVRAIGPKTAATVEPYHFLSPPTARVNGHIPLGEMKNGTLEMAVTDMRFDIIEGAPFQWRRLRTTNILGTLFWRGQTLLVTNVAAAFYGGAAEGFAYFDFRVPHEGADFNFAVDVTNVNLHLLAVDLSTTTNHLEGILAGQLVVTNASTMTLQSWNGYGHAELHDGLLWDIPIISIVSPMLNAIAPGLGNSRATEASGKFGITNGVGFTDSLAIRSMMTRLEYTGTIDLQQNVNARVTAHLLRDTPVIGSIFSTMLWPVSKIFEYRVTGQLSNPKSEPIYVLPRLLLFPLHPIRTIEDLIPGGSTPTTNRPAGN